MLGFLKRREYDAFFTTGEDIGLPLAALLKASRGKRSHTMIAHTLLPAKKRVFFKAGVGSQLDEVLVYSTTEEQLATTELKLEAAKVHRIAYHADERFFRPGLARIESDLVCAAGQLLRDYECLVEAVRGLPLRVQIAAGSPWIDQKLEPRVGLPSNVTWGKLNRAELRHLYARSALAIVPIKQNHYQTGIATILEMMAMGKCVIATRTHGQTDTIVDGETGRYTLLEEGGTVVGLFPKTDYTRGTAQLKAGDILVCCTDGILEACNEQEEEFGSERLAASVLRHREKSAQAIIEDVLAEVNQWCLGVQADDKVLMVMKVSSDGVITRSAGALSKPELT